jgi:hypothetical protein
LRLHHLHHGTQVQLRNNLYITTIMLLRNNRKSQSHQDHPKRNLQYHNSMMHKSLHRMIISVMAMQ